MARPCLIAPCLLQHVPRATGDSNALNPASVIMVEPATPRMGAVSARQAGLDPTAWKVPAAHWLSSPPQPLSEWGLKLAGSVTPTCLLGCL